MRTITVELFDDGLRLSNDTLGRAGEKNIVQFVINFDALRYSGLTMATLLYKPRNSPVLAMPSVEIPEGDLVTLVPDWAMAVFGVTQVQLQLTGEGVETRSYIWNMRVERSLINYGDKPAPLQDWLQEVRDVIDDAASLTGFRVIDYFDTYDELIATITTPVPGAAYGVGTAAPYDVYVYGETSGWTNIGPIAVGGGGTGAGDGVIFVPSVSDDGTLSWKNNGDLPNPEPVNIKGADGFSPTISTEQVLGGYRLTIENPGGNYEQIIIRNGTAPTVRVEKIDGGNRVTITGANGPSSFDVMDGKDGAGGGAVDVDATLTVAGAAADAAATGERLSQLSEEMAKQGKPLVFIDGVIPTTKDDVLAELTYEHGAERWHAYIEIKCQGSSSMSYPKKNFTVKLYEDAARSVKMKRKMFGWPVASNKYVLKANYIDHTHARNIVNARLWGEVVASRPDYDTLPVELRNSPNNGAIDGYPIIVYTNGTYQGLYTWNIGKDPWMVGMDEDNPDHVFLCNEQNTNTTDSPSNFRALWDGNEFYWKVEIGEGCDAVTAAFNNLVNCAMNDDDAAFRANIAQYLDVQSAIDYYLHQYVICGLDGLGKNMPLIKYSPLLWRLTAYDMDATWLLWWTGGSFVQANYACPEQYQESRNLLFERIAAVYADEMLARYAFLRKKVYSYANIMSHFESVCGQIGKETYADDLVPYPNIPSADTNNIWQLRNAVRDRLAYCDTKLLGVDVTEVDYIESDGASWIDTGIKPDSDMIVECGIFNPAQEMNYENYFGTFGTDFSFQNTAGAPTNWVNVVINGTSFNKIYAPNAQNGAGYLPMAGIQRDISFDLSLAGVEWTSTETLWLFAKRNNSKSGPDVPGTFRLSYAKLTRKSTGEVLLDLLPAVDNGGIPGMYDSVSKKMLYNAGTGEFAVPTT